MADCKFRCISRVDLWPSIVAAFRVHMSIGWAPIEHYRRACHLLGYPRKSARPSARKIVWQRRSRTRSLRKVRRMSLYTGEGKLHGALGKAQDSRSDHGELGHGMSRYNGVHKEVSNRKERYIRGFHTTVPGSGLGKLCLDVLNSMHGKPVRFFLWRTIPQQSGATLVRHSSVSHYRQCRSRSWHGCSRR